MSGGILTREQILGARDLKAEQVSVPEWGGDIIVRTMTAAERDRFEDHCGKLQGKTCEGIMALLVALTVVDGEGNTLFTESDISSLGGKSAAAVSRVFDVARRLNKLSNQDVEDLAKN